jgi:hypothetical protein
MKRTKKIIALAAMMAVGAGGLFAQVADGISVNGWGRAAFAPIIHKGEYKVPPAISSGSDTTVEGETYAGTGTNWGDPVALELDITGATSHVGFGLGLTTEGGIGANATGANVWAKPFGSDLLTLSIGKGVDDTLRGKVGEVNDGWEYFVLPLLGGEKDDIFTRFKYGGTSDFSGFSLPAGFTASQLTYGALLTSAPLEGLYIGARVNAPNMWTAPLKAEDVYRYIQIGAGYEIANVGLVRAQFFGGWTTDDGSRLQDEVDSILAGGGTPNPANLTEFVADADDAARIEAAFALTALEGITIDIGTKIWLPVKRDIDIKAAGVSVYTDKHEFAKGIQLSVGAIIAPEGAFSLAARVDSTFGGSDKTDADNYDNDPFILNAHLVPAFDLGFAKVGLDVGMQLTSATSGKRGGTEYKADDTKDDSFDFGIGAFIHKGFANGYIKTGLALTLDGQNDGLNDKNEARKYIQPTFSIPVVIEYWF